MYLQTGIIPLLACLLLLVGCGAKPDKRAEKSKEKEKEEQEDPGRLYTGSGEATVRDPEGDRLIQYVIRWEKTQLDYTLEKGASGGRLEKVTGELYQDGKVASTFTAKTAIADKAKKLLVLEGDVVVVGDPTVTSDEQVASESAKGKVASKVKLNCQRLEWKTDKELLKVFKRVTLRSEQGVIGPVEELWCLPDLKRAGTPGFWR